MLKVRLNLSKVVAIATCFAVTTMFSGCDEDEKDPEIKVENEASLSQTVYADQTGGVTTTFVTAGAWSSTITEGSVKSTKSGTASWLSINPDRGSAAGTYSIVISIDPNLTGAERSATITVKCGDTEISIVVTQKTTKEDGEPYLKSPTLTTTDPTNVTATTATAGGNITDAGVPAYTERGICYATTPNPVITDTKMQVDGNGTGSFTANLTGLIANTLYYVRAYVTTDAGTTTYGNEVSFTTAMIEPVNPEDMPPIYRNVIRISYLIDASLTQEITNFYPNISTFSFNAAETAVSALWNNSYSLIYKANDVMEYLDLSQDKSEAEKNSIKAEAMYYRAYAYSVLLNYFGEIPLIHRSGEPRASRQEIEYLINSSCDYSSMHTPVSGAVSRCEVLQLKARVLLNSGNYMQAFDCLRDFEAYGYLLAPLDAPFGTDAISQGIEVLPGMFPTGFLKGNRIYPMRFTETLLIRAEALAQFRGPDAEAYQMLNMLYASQGMEYLQPPLTLNEFLAEIVKLANILLNREGLTFSYLKRAGTDTFMGALGQYGATVPKNLLLPIPLSAIEANPNLTQNPGW